MTIPDNMRAVILTGHGGPEKLEYRTDFPVPAIADDEVLVAVGACGVNNTDIWVREGAYGSKEDPDEVASFGDNPLTFPRIQGADIVGRICAVGAAVGEERIGERVMVDFGIYDDADENAASVDYLGHARDGGFAEYVAVPAENAHAVDSDLSDAELATFCCAYITAERMLKRARVAAGETVLVTGASGGVGSGVIQLCKARGARPVAVSSPGNEDALLDIGAEAVVSRAADDMKSAAMDAAGGPFDVVVDTVAGALFSDLLAVLRKGGRYVSCGAIGGPVVEFDTRTMYLNHLDLIGSSQGSRRDFRDLLDYVASGRIRPLLAKTYALADIATAQADFAKKDFFGKLVIEI